LTGRPSYVGGGADFSERNQGAHFSLPLLSSVADPV
jgi:hypothetical protein